MSLMARGVIRMRQRRAPRYPLSIITCAVVLLAAKPSAQASNVAYTYNSNHQLTQLTYDNGIVVTYTYDANGNRSGASVNTPAVETPTSLSATSTSGTQINLAWTGSPGVTGYYIWRCAGSGCTNFANVHPSTGTTYSDTGLAGLTTYVYEIQAYKTSGSTTITSALSTAASATTGAQPPTAPTNLTATGSHTSSSSLITLTWTASTDDVGISGYTVQRCQGSGCTTFSTLATPAGTSYADSGVSQGQSYSYRVLATNTASQQSGWSGTASAVAPAYTPPGTPPSLSGSAASWSTVNLTWGTSADSFTAVAGYKVYRNGTQVATTTGTSYTDSTTAPGTTYPYAVSAYDAWGNTSTQATVSVTTPPSPSPSAPGGLTGHPASDTSITLTWNAASDSGGPGIAGYNIFRNGSFTGTSVGTTFTDTGLSTFGTYSYTVSAFDNFDTTSLQSTAVSVTVGYEIANSTGLLPAGAGYSISQGEVAYSNSEYYWYVYAPNGQQVATATTGQNGYEPACYDDQQGTYSAASGYQLNECILWAAPSVYQ